MDLSQYLDLFLEEAQEHLQNLNSSLLVIEKDPDNSQVIDEIFRAAHTLKGMSATMGFNQIAELTHEMEDLLTKIRGHEIKVSSAIIDILFKGFDSLTAMIDSIRDGKQDTFAVDDLIALLKNAGNEQQPEETVVVEESVVEQPTEKKTGLNQIDHDLALNDYETAVIHEAHARNFVPYHITVELSKSCVMKVARAVLVFRALEQLDGEVIKSLPPVQEIEEERFDYSFELIYLSPVKADEIIQNLTNISEVERVSCQEISLAELQEVTPRLRQEEQGIKQVGPTANNPQKKAKINQTVRVDISRLDVLMNLVGELVINKTRLDQICTTNNIPGLNETLEQIDRITFDLQAVVMKVRMVPIEQVFNRFPRMVRDLAKEMHKEVDLIIEGKETELDRTVIDEIGDPLVHLLRNSIDHGIELPEIRKRQQKSLPAKIRLAARHEGNNVVIEVEDDGQGIDPGKIGKKAIEKGLITQQQYNEMDDKDLINLIFMPGFSTAAQITDISGRGVGLDVVKTKIESLNGSVETETKPGQGTKFQIRLPLTLAIIQALLVKVGGETYAIPLSSIDETTAISLKNIKRVQNHEVMLLRGSVLPLLRLDQVLNTPEKIGEEEQVYVVVVHKGEKQVGLIVESLIGQQEIVIKSLGKLLTGIPGIAGATILGNGHVSLILDIGSLF